MMIRSLMLAALAFSGGLVATGAAGAASAATAPTGDAPDLVIILSRHGVRSPTAAPGSLDVFSDQPWPRWNVPPGYLTPHGKQLMAQMGGWYRSYYADAGLLSPAGCADAAAIVVIADDEERTVASAHGLVDGFAPGCPVAVHASTELAGEPLFSHHFGAAFDPDRAIASAAVLGRIGGLPGNLAQAHVGAIALMQATLLGCDRGSCTPSQTAGRQLLLDQPSSIGAGEEDALISIKSPLHVASTFAENFALEYTQGLPLSQVAWGRLSAQQLGQLLQLHSDYSDIALRTAPIARDYAAPLAYTILATLQQGATHKIVAGALGNPSTRVAFLVGHDTNISTLAGMLGLHWMLTEQPTDPSSTGGALVFELRAAPDGHSSRVRVYYVSQSMEQMRASTTLTRASPPQIAPVFIPGCSQAASGYDCELEQLAQLVRRP